METYLSQKLSERRAPLTFSDLMREYDPLGRVDSFRVVNGKIITTTVREKLLGVVDAEYEVVDENAQD